MRDFRKGRRKARIAFVAAFVLVLLAVAFVYRFGADTPDSPGTLAWVSFWILTMLGLLGLLVWGGIHAHEAAHFARLERGEGVLARWTIAPAEWRELCEERRAHERESGLAAAGAGWPDEAPPTGIEVVVSRDAVFVGQDGWQPLLDVVPIRATLRGRCLEFEWSTDEGSSLVRAPVPRAARADAERLASKFNAAFEAELRKAREARARPTLANHLLTWVEGHFVAFVLLFFFVLLPGFVGLLYLLSVWFGVAG